MGGLANQNCDGKDHNDTPAASSVRGGDRAGVVSSKTPIYIYSTINLYCGSMDITALIKEYQEDQYAEKEITEEVFEQEIQEEAEGGVEDERETVEENIY